MYNRTIREQYITNHVRADIYVWNIFVIVFLYRRHHLCQFFVFVSYFKSEIYIDIKIKFRQYLYIILCQRHKFIFRLRYFTHHSRPILKLLINAYLNETVILSRYRQQYGLFSFSFFPFVWLSVKKKVHNNTFDPLYYLSLSHEFIILVFVLSIHIKTYWRYYSMHIIKGWLWYTYSI